MGDVINQSATFAISAFTPFIPASGHAKRRPVFGAFARSLESGKMPVWAAQQLRVSLFSSTPVALTEAKHWKVLTGQDEAENRIGLPGGRQYSGKFLSGTFNLAFYGQRCDIIETHDESASDPAQPPALPTLGPWDDELEKFLDRVMPFVEAFDFPIIRIAIGAILLAETDTVEASYQILAEMLRSVKVDPAHMRELIYRVNWPTQSEAVKGLELNRITGWNSISYNRKIIQVSGVGEVSMQPIAESPPVQAARLDLDLNTAALRTDAFEKDAIVPILRELLSIAREIAESGEPHK